jgi:hypothetical protein
MISIAYNYVTIDAKEIADKAMAVALYIYTFVPAN